MKASSFFRFVPPFLLAFLSFFKPLEAVPVPHELFLRNNLKRAHQGDFIVTEVGKNYTLLHIYDKTPNSLIIEEITIPSYRISHSLPWRTWVQENAPGHTCWVMYEVNLHSGAIQEFFSFTKNSWLNIGQEENFLPTLLNLRLHKVPDHHRRRIGPPPSPGDMDRRPFWQPKMFVEGKSVEGVTFEAWKTRWPKDHTDLSGKLIEAYLPKENNIYPSYFPYWLQISGMMGKAKIRIVDSGSNLVSPKPFFPRRPPEFLDNGGYDGKTLRFSIKVKPHHRDLVFLAIATNEGNRDSSIFLPFSLRPTEFGDIFIAEITHEDLQAHLVKGHSYHFILKEKHSKDLFTETWEPFRWR